MPSKRDLKLSRYEISKYRYRELYNFCAQYSDFKKEKQSCYSLDSRVVDGMPKGSGISDSTARKAEKAARLSKYIELIEQAALEAAGELYPYVLRAVTEELTWELLCPPCGRRQFYELRRNFFILLDLRKG